MSINFAHSVPEWRYRIRTSVAISVVPPIVAATSAAICSRRNKRGNIGHKYCTTFRIQTALVKIVTKAMLTKDVKIRTTKQNHATMNKTIVPGIKLVIACFFFFKSQSALGVFLKLSSAGNAKGRIKKPACRLTFLSQADIFLI